MGQRVRLDLIAEFVMMLVVHEGLQHGGKVTSYFCACVLFSNSEIDMGIGGIPAVLPIGAESVTQIMMKDLLFCNHQTEAVNSISRVLLVGSDLTASTSSSCDSTY